MKKFLVALLLIPTIVWATPCFSPLCPRRCPTPLLSLGGGYWMAGKNHSSGLFQAEYKFGCNWLGFIRPQVSLIVPECRSLFVGAGIGVDLYLSDHLIICPNFEPGFYYGGKGKNLGHPIEFRSGVELVYEFHNAMRFGTQFWHISNASLSCRNPGANGWTLFLSLPFKFCY